MRQPIPFGKYLLLERISVGGMAEVFKAKAFGIEGFEKIVAIKRILPSMAEDADFIQMFIDEAKICGQLNHSNICQTYELGRIDDSHFIAMEYIWGKDMLQMQNRFRRLRHPTPPQMAAFIAAKVCEGLDYAHRKKDATGRPLGIIHRDVSPQNILISYEGEIKVIDFGIAKAASRSSKTQAGVLKGKFGYMSPEHVRGIELDRRSDIFSIGTILYEMLTNERLFLGESDFATLEKIRTAAVPPPSTLNPEIPPVLDEIIMKALAREVEDRYQWASEMQEALQNYLFSHEPVFSAKHLSAWMKEQFAAEMRREAQLLEEQRKIGREYMTLLAQNRSVAPPSARLRSPSLTSGLRTTPLPASPPPEPVQAPEPELNVDVETGEAAEDELLGEKTSISPTLTEEEKAPETGDSAPDLPAESTHIVGGQEPSAPEQPQDLVSLPTVVFAQGNVEPPAEQPTTTGTPPTAPEPAATSPPPAYPPPGSSVHPYTGSYIAPAGYLPYGAAGVHPPASTMPPAPPGGQVALTNGYSAAMSGVYVPPSMGSHPYPAPPPRANALWKDILVGVGVAVAVVLTVLGAKFILSPPKGTIILTVFPPSVADVQLDGRPVGRIQQGGSLLLREVARGPHQIRVVSDDLEGQQQVNITSAEPLQITVHLKSAQAQAGSSGPGRTGVLRLRLPPDGALVSIDGRVVTEGELQRGYVVAADVPHQVRISRAGRRDQSFTVTVPAGGEVERDVTLESARGKLIINSDPPGADVSINGQSRGRTPITVEDLEIDKPVRVSVKKRGYTNFVKYLSFGPGELEQTLDVRLSAPGGKTEEKAPAAAQAPQPEPVTTGPDGYLVANTKPWARVFIDGKDTNRTTPIAPRDRIPLRPGKHIVTFVANQKKYNFEIVIKPGEEKKLIQELGDGN
ncbi:MAG: serine/threonine-protein kinase [Myxococcales bacterium]|nr:serine/threonine-protein kinase [Myxococcales bacterium]